MPNYAGACLCGAVRFAVEGRLGEPLACHCGQCRRQSGHFPVASIARRADLNLLQADSLKWYRSSESARRGFCGTCGSFLFWTAHDEDTVSFALGALDAPTGLALEKHIFVADKGDYYDIADGVPQTP